MQALTGALSVHKLAPVTTADKHVSVTQTSPELNQT